MLIIRFWILGLGLGMMNSTKNVTQESRDVFIWVCIKDREMDFDWVSKQVGVNDNGRGPLRLEFFNYLGGWRNERSDKPDKTAVQLEVLSVSGNRSEFSYTARRTVGRLVGDVSAMRNQDLEWYEIHVTRSVASIRSPQGEIAATWTLVHKPE